MAPAGDPILSVLIVTYHSALSILHCLNSVTRHLATIPHDIHVVDNASQDETVSLVKTHSPRVALIPNECNRGFATAINQGLKQSRGRYVLWLNPDAELLDGRIAHLIRYLEENPRIGILGPRLIDPDGKRQLSCRSFPSYQTAFFNRYSLLSRLFPKNRYTRRYLHSDWNGETVREVDWVSGACLLHRREVSKQLGGLDERFFMYCEDVDFCLRANQVGWLTRYHPAARVLHHVGGSSRQIRRRMVFERHHSMWRYYCKHFQRKPLKDLIVGAALWARCGLIMLRKGG